LFILLYGKGLYISAASFIQIANSFMMDRMLPVPVVIRSEYQAAQDGSNNLVGFFTSEKRSMSAIMENNKQAHQEAGCKYSESQSKQVGYMETVIHGSPE
jgi:hypothetical protein